MLRQPLLRGPTQGLGLGRGEGSEEDGGQGDGESFDLHKVCSVDARA